ncbi:ankyrin, partial [Microthyrium microscopicum]
ACVSGNLWIARVLRSGGAVIDTPDQFGYQPIHFAAGSSNVGLVSYLIEHRADVNAKTIAGKTPLHVACRSLTAPPIIVARLLNTFADCNSLDACGETPLHYA